MKSSLFVRGGLLLALVVCMCGKTSKKGVEVSPQQYGISGFTSGVISRESPIRILFTEPVFSDTSKLNVPLDQSPLSFSPAIKGVAVWTSFSTLEFRPSERLESGKTYTGTVKTLAQSKGSKNLKPFTFNFTGMMQSFTVEYDGLAAVDNKRLDYQRFTGRVVTADVDVETDIEKIVSVTQEGRKLPVFWTHSEDRRIHTFTADSVIRKDNESQVKVVFSGKSIGVDNNGEEAIGVPSLNDFNVGQIRAVQDSQNYIEIRFSDPLSSSQRLNGLVNVDGYNDCRFTVDNNILKVFSSRVFVGSLNVTVERGIKNSMGKSLNTGKEITVVFEELKPLVRFGSKGVILPTSQGQVIPLEAVNVRAAIVSITRIYDKNVPQFMQVNDMDGMNEVKRVGRMVLKKKIDLGFTPEKRNQWMRCGLDVSKLVEQNPGGIYIVEVTFRKQDAVLECTDSMGKTPDEELVVENFDLEEQKDNSSWDYYDENSEYYDYENYNREYNSRENPCSDAYYKPMGDHTIAIKRNVLISDIGLVCKAGADTVRVSVSDIKTTNPMKDVAVKVIDYQQQVLSSGTTDANGFVSLGVSRAPFMVIAEKSGQSGYVKLAKGNALSISHFDVAGEKIEKGLKGFIYGERGVWRPGDSLFLTFILNDPDKKIPPEHPVTFELTDARGRLVKTMKTTQTSQGFYSFKIATMPSDPTGDWMAKVKVGGAVFQKPLKIETVMPNRLKIKIDFGKKMLSNNENISAELSSQWLHGAIADNLETDVQMTIAKSSTSFSRYADYVFDDPTQKYESESFSLFSGKLNSEGKAQINSTVKINNKAPGMLMASFKTRVFEPGGAFSTDNFSIPFSPYNRYIGLATPKGDVARGMLLTDTTHRVRLVALKADGTPAADTKVEVKLYKISWRWWWEQGDESLADYENASGVSVDKQGVVDIKNGEGYWDFKVKYPEWGRYLIKARDLNGEHAVAKVVYIDWPGWAGRAQKEGSGANVLTFSSDKASYATGENVEVTIPAGKSGRALISLENGRKVLRQDWIEPKDGTMKYSFKADETMVPNIYISVTYLQPHLNAGNDVPIRTYGVIPVKVSDPKTVLHPEVKTPSTFKPQEKAKVTVSEADGREMTYTLAVVDEGLLDLTRFATPDPWTEFNKREALGVTSWDVYDQVCGAYGATIERLLSIGGSDEGADNGGKKKNRFPPMVRFYGPFELKKGKNNDHDIDIPLYTGSVRVMVVAGDGSAWGKCDTAVPVKKPVMVLATLPRVLSINEEASLPVSVFALDQGIKKVKVSIDIDGPLTLAGEKTQTVTFDNPGDELCTFKALAGEQTGTATVTITASSGMEKATEVINIDIRTPMRSVTSSFDTLVKERATLTQAIKYPGIKGSNKAILEVSRLFPLNLGERLNYLIHYPYGCIEQTTSSVFPQVYLPKIMDLSKAKQQEVQKNVEAGISRLRTFQTSDGGFAYWPGEPAADEWGSNYAGHFLIEAQAAGFAVSSAMMQQWVSYQQKKARAHNSRDMSNNLNQSYRLFTLALAGKAELGAMNRLREVKELSQTDKWMLAASYYLAGQKDVGLQMLSGASMNVKPYREFAETYGSDFRDKAIILQSLVFTDQVDKAFGYVNELTKVLNDAHWLSTQEIAYALVAIGRLTSAKDQDKQVQFAYKWNKTSGEYTMSKATYQVDLDGTTGESGELTITNKGSVPLYARVLVSGIPAPGTETSSSSGLTLKVKYEKKDGGSIDESTFEQGDDIVVKVTVANTGVHPIVDNIALSHLLPAGWEIHNNRMSTDTRATNSEFDYQDIRDDRVYTFFSLRKGQEKTFTVLANASYTGKFYLPMIYAEAMYDASVNAVVAGRWISIKEPQ
jgi:alpha-2-macroglobulin